MVKGCREVLRVKKGTVKDPSTEPRRDRPRVGRRETEKD